MRWVRSICTLIGVSALFLFLTFDSLTLAASPGPLQYEIRIFSADWCPYCHKVKNLLEEEGIVEGFERDRYSVRINIVDITQASKEEALRLGALQEYVPEIQVRDQEGTVLSSGTVDDVLMSGLAALERKISRGSVGWATDLGLALPQVGEGVEDYLKKIQALARPPLESAPRENPSFQDLLVYYIEASGEKADAASEGKWLTSIAKPQTLTQKSLSPTAVVLIGTGRGPEENPIYVGRTLMALKKTLIERLSLSDHQIVTLYGYGDKELKESEADAVEERDKLRVFTRVRDLKADASFDERGLAGLREKMHQASTQRALWIFVGHGEPDGVALWGGPALRPDDWESYLGRLRGDNIIVSGNCYGGQMALSASCGFFAARPDTTAEGCWEDEKVIKNPHYVGAFMKAFESSFLSQADGNGDGQVSFSEAHWFATLNGNASDSTYTSVDALADVYFELARDEIPSSLSVSDLKKKGRHLTESEKGALNQLLDSYSGWERIFLKNTIVKFSGGAASDKDGADIEAQVLYRRFSDEAFTGENPEFSEKSADEVISAVLAHEPGALRNIRLQREIGGEDFTPYQAQVFLKEWGKDDKPTLSISVDYAGDGDFKEVMVLKAQEPVPRQRRALTQIARRVYFKEIMASSHKNGGGEKTDPLIRSLKSVYEEVNRCEDQDGRRFLSPP